MNESKKENSKPLSSERVIDAQDLFGKDKVVIIQYANQRYRLMITRQGKLILNK